MDALFWIEGPSVFPQVPAVVEEQDTPHYISKQVEQSRLFFLDAREEETFAVRCGGYERCRPEYRIERAGFDWFCLEFVSRGNGRLEMDGAAHELRSAFDPYAGVFVILP